MFHDSACGLHMAKDSKRRTLEEYEVSRATKGRKGFSDDEYLSVTPDNNFPETTTVDGRSFDLVNF